MTMFKSSWLLLCAALLLSCGTAPMLSGTETGNGTSGAVLGLNGKPVRGARVTLVPVDYNELEPPQGAFMICSEQTDSMGKYCFVNVTGGRYSLFCDSGANKAYVDSVSITGKPGDTISTISLKKTGSVTGTALYSSGKSLEYAFVVLQGSRVYAQVNSVNGAFSLPNLAPGTYLAKVVTQSSGYFDIALAVNVMEGRADTLRNPFLLVSTSVTSLACDSFGVWIGTTNGLANMRKGNWRTYGLPDGLLSSRINCVVIDNRGTAWAGTSLGLACIRNDSLMENFLSLSLPTIMNVTALAADSAGNIWIGTPQGLFLCNGPGVTMVVSNDALSVNGGGSSINELTAVTAALCLPAETIVGTMHGVFYRGSDKVWNSITELDDDAVSCMASDGRNTVWIGTNQGLRLWDRPNRTLSVPADSMQIGAVTCLTVCGADSVYVGSANGLFLYSESRFTRIDLSAGNSNISALALDSTVALWVGTNDGIIRIESGLVDLIQ